MKSLSLILALMTLVNAASGEERGRAGENTHAVVPAPRRLESIKKAEALLALIPPETAKEFEGVSDPFFRSVKVTKEKGPTETHVAAPEATDAEILAGAAQQISPTGTMLIGDEHYLLISGKRIRKGESVTVTVGTGIYRITVSSIERNSYTLRLNDEELRREFK